MSLSWSYPEFLQRAVTTLGSIGAHTMFEDGKPAGLFDEWDDIVFRGGAAGASLFAFTQLTKADGEELQQRVSRLADFCAGRNWGPRALDMVVIAAMVDPVDAGRARSLTSVRPSQFHSRIRPSTWIVSLSDQRLETGRALRAPAGKEQIQMALSGTMVDPAQSARLQEGFVKQQAGFYSYLRGRRPIVTYSLIAINVAAFLFSNYYASGTSRGYDSALVTLGALVPTRIEDGDVWRLFTAMFLHANFEHIFLNMISLMYVGVLAERLYGSRKFLIIYLCSGLTGSVASVFYNQYFGDPNSIGIGASGAIFGIVGALLTLRFQRSEVVPLSVRRGITSSILPIALLNLVGAKLLVPNVDESAHVGGLIGGIVFSFLFPLPSRASDEQQAPLE